METKRNYLIAVVCIGLILVGFSPATAEKSYPVRPIEVVLPWPPGGVGDLGTRYLGEMLREFLGQPVVTVNKPGGGGLIGSKFVANAKPDGYTLLSGGDSCLITSRVGKKDIGFDLDSFKFICRWVKNSTFYNVRANSRWKNMSEIITYARENPGKLKCGIIVGVTAHYAVALLEKSSGAKFNWVPFKSGPESLTALLGGHVDLAATSGLGGMADAELVRPIAVAEEKRLWDKPNVSTLKELGYPVVLFSSYGLCGPKDLPDEIVTKLLDANRKVFEKGGKELDDKFLKMGGQYASFVDGNTYLNALRAAEKQFEELAPQIAIKQ